MTKSEQIKIFQNKLGLTEQEALELYAYDKSLNGKEPQAYDLSPEKTKIANSFLFVGNRPKTPQEKVVKAKPTKKVNDTKLSIIANLYESLTKYPNISQLLVVNDQKTISFTVNGNDYELNLTQHRQKK